MSSNPVEDVSVSYKKKPTRKVYFWAVGLLAVMHLAGIIGYITPGLRDLFLLLTPFNLVCMTAVLLYFQRTRSSRFIIYIVCAFILGFIAEAIGVSTGYLFGDYAYGKTLGPKLLGVPLVIGLNWVSLTCISGVLCDRLPLPDVLKAFIGAMGLVLLDVVIEPVAIQYDFWQWQGGIIPWGNYIGWLLIGFLILLIFYRLKFNKQNPMALPVFIIQLLFFLTLFIYLSIV